MIIYVPVISADRAAMLRGLDRNGGKGDLLNQRRFESFELNGPGEFLAWVAGVAVGIKVPPQMIMEIEEIGCALESENDQNELKRSHCQYVRIDI